MGEVFRAHDPILGRDVAVKVLPEQFAGDRDRVARLEREARIMAALNHPNIAAIHGLAESASGPALVLELIEGPTLADRLTSGPLPIDEALRVGRQIADAIEAAHEQDGGYVQRRPAANAGTAFEVKLIAHPDRASFAEYEYDVSADGSRS
jgi:serine/threonine-protein kinase